MTALYNFISNFSYKTFDETNTNTRTLKKICLDVILSNGIIDFLYLIHCGDFASGPTGVAIRNQSPLPMPTPVYVRYYY